MIAQIETDKVTMDIKYTAKDPGVMTALHIASGDVVQVRVRGEGGSQTQEAFWGQ